jgi:hypothetical protein
MVPQPCAGEPRGYLEETVAARMAAMRWTETEPLGTSQQRETRRHHKSRTVLNPAGTAPLSSYAVDNAELDKLAQRAFSAVYDLACAELDPWL